MNDRITPDMTNRTIRIRTLTARILMRWKLLLLFGIIGAVLLGGFRTYKNLKAQKNAEQSSLSSQAYEEKLATYKEQKESLQTMIDQTQETLDQKRAYLAKTLLARIDSDNEPRASADISITPSETSNTAILQIDYIQLVAAYRSFLLHGIDWSGLSAKLGLDETSLQELVTVEDNDLTTDQSLGTVSNTISFYTIYTDLETAQEIRDEIIRQMKEKIPEFAESVGAHELEVVNTFSGTISDPERANWLNYKLGIINGLSTSLQKLESERNKLTPPTTPVTTSTREFIKSVIKYVIAGFILGAAAMVLLILIRLVSGGTVLSAEELADVSGLRLLACLPEKKVRRGKIDALIDRLDAEHRNSLSPDDAFLLAAENLKAFISPGDTILLTGDVPEKELLSVCDALSEKMKAAGLSVSLNVSASLIRDAMSVRQLDAADAIIFVEKTESSRYPEIRKQLQAARDRNKKLCGTIVL